MNLKIVIIGSVVTLVLAFAGLYLASRPSRPAADLNPSFTGRLTAAETFYDFGTVSMKKGIVSRKFTLSNSDSTSATVTKLYTSCMCTQAQITVSGRKWGPYGMPSHSSIPAIASVIAPGSIAEVEVFFDPNAHGPAGVGQIERVVTIEQNGQAPLSLNIRANVIP